MIYFLQKAFAILSCTPFLISVETLSLLIKSYIIVKLLLNRTEKNTQFQRAWFLLILILVGSIIEDTTWLIKLLQLSIFPNLDYRIILFTIRIAWMFTIIQYQSLALLVESLIPTKTKRLSFVNKLFMFFSVTYCLIFIWLLVFKTINLERPIIEFKILNQIAIYVPIITFVNLIFAFIRLRKTKIPKILRKQLNIFMLGLIGPKVLSDSIQIYPFDLIPNYITSNYAVITLSSLLIAYTAYFCINRMMRLRFLNFRKHVVAADQSDEYFINRFKSFLEQLSKAITPQELRHIVKTYFREVLNITDGKIDLFIRNLNNNENKNISFFRTSNNDQSLKANIVENFINTNPEAIKYLNHLPALILDEIEFNHFYQDNQLNLDLLTFLRQINAEMFVPIYQENIVIAYIIIEHDPTSKRLYSNIERDEIAIFSKYLGNIINLMQKRSLDTLIEQEKALKEELYQKHQQVNQYKESIKSFIRQTHHKKIGIIFYHARRFVFGNQDAKEMIDFNINLQPGHPLTKKLSYIAKQVEDYKAAQSCFAKDNNNNLIVLNAIPNLEENNVIITMHYPDITDIIKKQIDLLVDSTQWDYLLYLETTKSGQLINKLIPGSGELLLNFKIELLKTTLSKKAILISMPAEDLIPTVELIHHLSLRETLYTIKLHSPASNFDTSIQLFGINPIFGKNIEAPLLQTLNNIGTLFIENIDYLNLETQDYLAEFIRYGFYRTFRSEKKQFSDVRIICSTNQNLQVLVQEGKFSQDLYKELQKTTLSLPAIVTLPTKELDKLIEDIANETIGNGPVKTLLELNDKEKQILINKCPTSIKELKIKVQNLLNEKSKKNHIHVDTQFNIEDIDLNDPTLSEAIRLGKYALKNPQIMEWMWNKFKNQNKIASLLGVNRSSVYRRCKDFDLYKNI